MLFVQIRTVLADKQAQEANWLAAEKYVYINVCNVWKYI